MIRFPEGVRGLWAKVWAWSFFDLNFIFIIQLGYWQNFGWNGRPWWPGWVLSLFLAYFGMKSTRMPSTRPNHTSFYPQNTINILLLCCQLLLDVETEVWRGSDFDPCWHPFCCFFYGNDQKSTSHQPLGVFTPILLQWYLFITRA